MPYTIIEIDSLSKDYGSNRAVDNLNLKIKKGEIFGLLGPNGAGKTTTILMMLGLTEPNSGNVKIKGHDATTEATMVKKIVGYLPDQVGFYENRTGIENLIYTAKLNNLSEEKALLAADRLMDEVGLSEVKNDRVGTYSKGMRQRLGLADVLIKEPEIIILDEPTIGIDPKGINEFLTMIRKLSKENGITVLLSSHLLQQVQKICDRVGLFVDGKLLALGKIDELASKLFEDQQINIRFRAENINDILMKTLENLDGVIDISRQDKEVNMKCRENIAPEIAETIVKNQGSLLHLSYQEYGLDDIYQYYFEGGKSHVN